MLTSSQNIIGQAYHIKDAQSTYYLTFQLVHWIDIFTRERYRDIVVQLFNYCIQHKGLRVYAWVIMSNHVHCIVESSSGRLADTIRDLKSHPANRLSRASRKGQKAGRSGCWFSSGSLASARDSYTSYGHMKTMQWKYLHRAQPFYTQKSAMYTRTL